MKNTLFVLLFAFNCLAQEKENNIVKTLDSISKSQFTLIYQKDIDGFLNVYAKNYFDLGNDEYINRKEWKKRLEQYVNSTKFNELKGKSGNEIVDGSKTQIYNYEEIKNSKINIDQSKFKLQKNDYLVYIYFLPEYNIGEDGWYGFFRLIDGKWKVVAGD